MYKILEIMAESIRQFYSEIQRLLCDRSMKIRLKKII
jgi:hypothetical protein